MKKIGISEKKKKHTSPTNVKCCRQTSSRKFYDIFRNDNHDSEKKKDEDDGSREEVEKSNLRSYKEESNRFVSNKKPYVTYI